MHGTGVNNLSSLSEEGLYFMDSFNFSFIDTHLCKTSTVTAFRPKPYAHSERRGEIIRFLMIRRDSGGRRT
jgi:hypothetical protein